MIGKRGKLLLLLYVLVLIILFLMCSTDLLIKEPDKEIYQIAVIIEDVRDDNYSNFRKGMDQAAVELNADVRFITLYEKQDANQQMEFINREQQDGTNALIIAPADENRLVSALTEKQITIPIILLGSELTGQGAAGSIIIDYKKMGEQLAEQMLETMDKNSVVLLLCNKNGQSRTSHLFLEGAVSVLEQANYNCKTLTQDDENASLLLLEELETMAGKQAVVFAESPELLIKAAGILEDNPSYEQYVKGIYGRGSTLQILNYLDRDIITGICITDEFSRGYFSVQMAVQALEGLGGQNPMTMESYYIQKKDLRESKYENMLFPIE